MPCGAWAYAPSACDLALRAVKCAKVAMWNQRFRFASFAKGKTEDFQIGDLKILAVAAHDMPCGHELPCGAWALCA